MKSYAELQTIWNTQNDTMLIWGLFVVFIALVLLIYTGVRVGTWILRGRRAKAMSPRSKKAQAAFLASREMDAITNGVEDAVAAGHMKRREAQGLYRRLAKQMGFWGLVPRWYPRHPNPDLLAFEINERLDNGVHKPVQLPDGRRVKPRNKIEATLLSGVK